jgi:hypothetical protein
MANSFNIETLEEIAEYVAEIEQAYGPQHGADFEINVPFDRPMTMGISLENGSEASYSIKDDLESLAADVGGRYETRFNDGRLYIGLYNGMITEDDLEYLFKNMYIGEDAYKRAMVNLAEVEGSKESQPFPREVLQEEDEDVFAKMAIRNDLDEAAKKAADALSTIMRIVEDNNIDDLEDAMPSKGYGAFEQAMEWYQDYFGI